MEGSLSATILDAEEASQEPSIFSDICLITRPESIHATDVELTSKEEIC